MGKRVLIEKVGRLEYTQTSGAAYQDLSLPTQGPRSGRLKSLIAEKNKKSLQGLLDK